EDRGTPAERAPASWSPREDTPTRLILVRHGRTAYTAERRYSGRGDVPLSDVGLAEVAAAADRVGRLVASAPDRVAVVVTSPLVRCAATAEAIARRLGDVPVRIEKDLVECDFGEWDGLTFAEVSDRYPEQLARWLESTAVAPPGGESFRSVTVRVRRVAAAIRSAYQGQTLVMVSHVSPIKVLLRDALAADDAFLYRMHLDPAGISVVDTWPDGGVSVRTVNDTSHL
ncbi:MAG TPA: histidine phosphatase family protein, partial [Micromonosporaceae bacterium]